jgi:hypothetical protein
VIDGREWEWGLEPFGMTDIDIAIAIVIATCAAVSEMHLNDYMRLE